MTIYLAARFSLKDYVLRCADELRAAGLDVTARWMSEPCSPQSQLDDFTPEHLLCTAVQDLEDIDFADYFLFFAEPAAAQPPRGGRHVEFGYALGTGKRIGVIGEKENIFHYLPRVEHFASWEVAKRTVVERAGNEQAIVGRGAGRRGSNCS